MAAQPPSQRWTLSSTVVVLALAAIVYIAYFRHCAQFGFYSDDHAFFGGVINRDWQAEISQVTFCLTKWPQGRPLGMGINLSLVPFLVFHLGGLHGLFLFAFAIVAINVALIYHLLRHTQSPLVALCAAGFYGVAPADTVQISLVFAYNFEIAVCCALLAALAALRRRWTWFALGTAASLLMVEPAAMFALFAPLILGFRRERSWRREAAWTISVWVGVVALILALRRILGDPWGSERVSEIAANPMVVVQHGLTSALVGFRTHFQLVAQRLAQPYREIDARMAWVIFSATMTAAVAAVAAKFSEDKAPEANSSPTSWDPPVRLCLAGVAIMLSVYFSYFREPWYPADWKAGFMSGVHVISALGSCLVFAGLVALLARLLPVRARGAAWLAPVAVIASLAGFGDTVQRDYADSWSFQRTFWKAYVRLCPDATDGTYVLVLDRNIPRLRYADLFSWGAEILPGAMFGYQNHPLPARAGGAAPAVITRPPAVIWTAPEVNLVVQCANGHFGWKPNYYFMLPKGPEQQPQAGNVIALFRDSAGNWQRLEGDIPVDGGVLPLRRSGGDNVLAQLPKNPVAAIYGLD